MRVVREIYESVPLERWLEYSNYSYVSQSGVAFVRDVAKTALQFITRRTRSDILSKMFLPLCPVTQEAPAVVAALTSWMEKEGVDAFIIPSDDPHLRCL